MTNIRLSHPARIALGYVAVAVLWIFTSDGLVAYLAADQEALARIQTWKGAAFVLVTGLALYALLRIVQPFPEGQRPGASHDDRFHAALLTLTFTILAALIVGFGALVYRQQTAVFKEHQYRQQAAIAELKAGQIERWVQWHRQEAEQLSADPDLVAAAKRHSGRHGEDDYRNLRQHFEGLLNSGRWFGIGLYAPDGRLLVTAGHELTIDAPHREAIATTASSGAFRLFDMHATGEGTSDAYFHIDFLVPLLAGPPGSRAVGVIVLSADPRQSLFQMAQTWPVPSASSETLLVRREGGEVVFMTPLRHTNSKPLALRKPLTDANLPATQAVLKGESVFEGVDYRGAAVLAAFRPVSGTNWHIIAKTDTDEVMRPLRQQAHLILVVMLLAIGAAGLFVALLWRGRQAAYAMKESQGLAEREALSHKFEALFQNARDSIFLIDASGRVVDANRAAMANYGYSDAEIRRLSVRDLRAPETRDTIERDFRDADRPEGAQFETLHQRKDGSVFPVEVSTRVIEVAGQRLRQSFIRNIAERKRAEATIRQQIDDLRRWYEVTLDREGRVGELKAEVNLLLRRLGEPPRYAAAEGEAEPPAPPNS